MKKSYVVVIVVIGVMLMGVAASFGFGFGAGAVANQPAPSEECLASQGCVEQQQTAIQVNAGISVANNQTQVATSEVDTAEERAQDGDDLVQILEEARKWEIFWTILPLSLVLLGFLWWLRGS